MFTRLSSQAAREDSVKCTRSGDARTRLTEGEVVEGRILNQADRVEERREAKTLHAVAMTRNDLS